ncbi:trypsin-like cysteine/serine peptidase domain-containing protein [Fennellomyces sp. T-0311]|nr:trypsin-like cysteine/serine peptidase domain-containing protein [Fennellomyces sp. T-0311]
MHSSISITLVVTLLSFTLISVYAIQDGEEVTDPSAYPFYVMLGNPHVCGGIIISFNPAIILTAAHCVADAPHPLTLPHNPYFVGYGHTNRKHQTINPIVDWVVHPEYENSRGQINMHHDLAIVKLQKSLKPSDRIDRVALWAAKNINIPRQAILMGYGYTHVDQPEARTLQRISLNVTRFTAGYSDMVEAMSAQDNEKACHGDSGFVSLSSFLAWCCHN